MTSMSEFREETRAIIHHENDQSKINIIEEILEEIKMLKEASSRILLNDVINGTNDPMCELFPSVSAGNPNG